MALPAGDHDQPGSHIGREVDRFLELLHRLRADARVGGRQVQVEERGVEGHQLDVQALAELPQMLPAPRVRVPRPEVRGRRHRLHVAEADLPQSTNGVFERRLPEIGVGGGPKFQGHETTVPPAYIPVYDSLP